MILAKNDIDIPEQWYHQHELKNNEEESVEIIYFNKGKMTPEYWFYMCYEDLAKFKEADEL